jgi:hypothetical protein
MRNSKYTIPIILALVALCCACICCAAVALYFYGDQLLIDLGINTPVSNQPQIPVTQPPTQTSNLPEWTVIVYSAADDDVLEEPMWFDVNEMELVGSNSQMNIVVQIDRYAGAFSGDGDWSDARRYYLTQDNNLDALTSPVVQSLGEIDTGDPQTLADFITWAVQSYPAKKYALVMSDHGGGWTGGFSDMSSSAYSDLSIPEIVGAIEQARLNTGVDKFELIGFDACLMGQIEVFGSLYPYSNFMVASEEVIPGYGWSYAAWLGQLAQNPAMDGRGLGQSIVSTYVINDVLLTELRATSDEIAQEESTTTLSAIESARVPEVISAMNQFVTVMASMDQTSVAEARTYARSYESVFGEDFSRPYVDLENFAEALVSVTGDTALQQAASQLQSAIRSAVAAEKHGPAMSGSNGISFHFPDSALYYLTEYGDIGFTYAEFSAAFLQQSSWDEFLAFHYTGQAYVPQEGQAFSPSKTAEVVGPGASELTISPLQISDTDVVGDEIITLSTTVSGNVSYIYFILYFYNPEVDAYWIGDESFVIAPNTIDLDGVTVPDYGPSPIQIDYQWDPTLFVLMDGQHEAFALFEPDEYLSAEGVTTYSVYGQYTYVNGSAPDDAKLVFDPDGNLLHIYALPDPDGDGVSTPVEVTPQIGDQFTDYVQSYYYDQNNEPYFDYSLSDDVFTYGEQGFWFESRYPVDGDYAIGIIAYDFDNNPYASYELITYKFEQ